MISIIIPLYNKEGNIVSTLNSILQQTYWDYEVLIVNDGSTDNSLPVVRNFLTQKNDGRFRIISQVNRGVSSARNRGVKESVGEYIAFLDADDVWEPTYLEEMAKLINDYPSACIYGIGYGLLSGGKKTPHLCRIPNNFRGVLQCSWNEKLMLYWTSSTCCNRQHMVLFDENLTHGEDLDVWFRMMLQGDAVFNNVTLAYYVQDSKNRAMNIVPAIDKHIVSVIERYRVVRETNEDFQKAFDTQMIYFLYEYMFTKYRKQATLLAKMLNYENIKWSLRFRMKYPYLYKLFKILQR